MFQHNHASSTAANPDPLLRVDIAAPLLGLAPATIKKWRTTRPGYGPRAFKMDQILCYRVSDLEAWLSRRCGRHVRLYVAPEIPHVMNLKQASEYLSISGASIYTWRTTRPGYGPPGFKSGSALRFHLEDLNAWVEAHLEPLTGEEKACS